MATAYEEALRKIQSGENESSNSSLPSYMVAGDTMNIANQNKTFLESATDAIEAVPQFIGASIISGASQVYNIVPDVGNFFGANFERLDTGEVITSLDSNLGAFYEEHQQGIDLVGFMLSSILPGTAGIKILNAGQKSLRTMQAGSFGANMGRSIGLLQTAKSTFKARALKEVATNSSAASITSGNALRAISAGFGQNALEALAFETAVTATMFNSPILENQDFGDFVANVAFGAGVFGLVGGTIDAVKISSSLKRAADRAAIEARPWTFLPEAATASKSYDRVVLDYEVLNNIPPIPTNVESSRQVFLKQSSDTLRTKLEGRIRKELGEIAGGDQEVAETLFNSFKAANIADQQSAFIGVVESTKFNATSKIAARTEKLQKTIDNPKSSLKQVDAAYTELAESTISVSYVKTWGEEAGRLMTEKPAITSIMDTLKAGQAIEVSTRGVKVTKGGKSFPFNTKFNQGSKAGTKGAGRQWNILATDSIEAQARYIWAGRLPPFKFNAKSPLVVHVDDIPLMEKVMLEVNPQDLDNVRFVGLAKGEKMSGLLPEFVANRKLQLANRIHAIAGTGVKTQEEIAAIVNVKGSLLSGEVKTTSVGNYHQDDILAMQSHASEYTARLKAQGSLKESAPDVDIWAIPQTVKLTYDSNIAGAPLLSGRLGSPIGSASTNHIVENMAIINQQQKLYQEATGRASAEVLGEDFIKLQEINSGKVFSGAVPSGAGAGFASAASSNYGTLAATVENIGSVTSRIISRFKDRARDSLEPLLYKLGTNAEASVEWSTLNSRVRAIEGQYGLNAAGDALEPLAIIRWKADSVKRVAEGKTAKARPTLANPQMEERIELLSQEVRDLAKVHIEVNGARTNGLASIRTSQGTQFNRSPEAFYPIPIDPKDFPFFALVTDESITSGGHSKTLFATSADELKGMIAKLKENPQLKIRTKGEAEQYFKERGTWDYEKTLSNNYLDVEAHRKGVSAPFIVATDPEKITSDMLKWHMQRETGLVREAVAAKYEVQFEELRRLGDELTNAELSKFTSQNIVRFADDTIKNPFADYIKTALGIRKNADYPMWVEPNKFIDQAFSKMYKKIDDVFAKSKSADDLAGINAALDRAGYKGGRYDEAMDIFANAEPAKGTLTSIVQKANSIMATVVLRWDPLNAVNNAVSANVLLGAETKAVIRAISRGDEEAVGALANLTRMRVPGTEETIMAPTKLIATAIRKFNRQGDDFKFYKDNGYMTSISDQYRNTLDDLTFNPKESLNSWDSRLNQTHAKLKAAGDKGEQFTGNKLAEEFNRFVAADVMKQMTDVAVSRNLMTGKEQLAYVNTFVNRTQGNYLAAQRPMMFQGPVGQAIGLFQTYQFNLMQQMLRHVGEGHSKDAMTLLALQGTIHGMNGLPAFNAVNTHLVGTASGNTEHRDAYDAVYGIAGKNAGDWLMYGVASNAMGLLHPDLKVNLYTRGDINPRQLTIVPTDPARIPIIQASAKVFANLFNTAKTLIAGGDVSTTLLQGLEHNGISRPLAGLAQTLQGLDNPIAASYSTSKRGNVIASNDLLSLANLGRIVGGKPLDEAIALDATYRFKTYGLVDAKNRQILGKAIKTTMIAGGDPTQDQIEDFALGYAKAGGRQEEFNKWFTQLYKTANLSQANKISQSLTSPFTQSMQKIMGGRELRDFTE